MQKSNTRFLYYYSYLFYVSLSKNSFSRRKRLLKGESGCKGRNFFPNGKTFEGKI